MLPVSQRDVVEAEVSDGNETTKEGFLDMVSLCRTAGQGRAGRKVFRELALFVPCNTNWQPRSPLPWTLA